MPSPSVALLRTQTDERLVALAAAGHERAFEAIVERYRRPLLCHCRRFLPEARAEDALQQALVSAWTALRRGDEVHELRPWLYRIVHNTSLNTLRVAGYDYEQLHDALQGSGGPAELAERSALLRHTLAGLAALPERQREALLRIAVEGRSQDEVAEELGLTHGAVRQLVHRARTSLRAAATAVVPAPLAGWLATGAEGRGDLVGRIGELVAGAGGGATLAKAGAVAVLAGGALGGPAVVDRLEQRPSAVRPAAAQASARGDDEQAGGRRVARHAPAPAATVARTTLAAAGHHGGARDRAGRADDGDDHSGPGPRGDEESDRSGRREDDDGNRSGPSDDGGERSGTSGGDDGDRSGPSGGDDGERSGTSGFDEVSLSGSSGDGERSSGSGSSSGGDVAEFPELDESSGSGSGSSGSGSAGSEEPDEPSSGGSPD